MNLGMGFGRLESSHYLEVMSDYSVTRAVVFRMD